MKRFINMVVWLAISTAFVSCDSDNTFQGDVDFMQAYTPIITLTSGESMIAISPSLQGRVMTSSANGGNGYSFGWINRALFASRDTLAHINPYGGEERFWLGPEGGQFGLFFKKGDPFDLEAWQTPALIDTEPFAILSQSDSNVVFSKEASLINYSGFEFSFTIRREIKIIPVKERGLSGVAYQTINTITNTGDSAWQKETGLLSIWLLGMFKPTDETTVIIPFNKGDENELGPVVIDDYFGKVPKDRLVIKDDICYFRGDGRHRGKIGLNPKRAKNILGSYDDENHVLTLIEYSKPVEATDYVNSKWEIQRAPYGGDVINSYNDGQPSPGAKPLGPFYELETSSPAMALKPGESMVHWQTTRHFQGSERELFQLARKELGIKLRDSGKPEFIDYLLHY
jgi:hypothetical protein